MKSANLEYSLPQVSGSAGALLSVQDLSVDFQITGRSVRAIDGVSFVLEQGQTLGIVGESGSGKSVTMLSLLGLLPPNGAVTGGRALFRGRDLLAMGRDDLRHIRGNDIAMVFQDPMTTLNPLFRVGDQLAEAVRAHRRVSQRQARDRAVELLDLVGVPDPARRARQYPHEFSGGMRQRVVIGMAIANDPTILIADEPTTALDVTVQAQVMSVLKKAKTASGAGLILITHDLGLVAQTADSVAVMYAGKLVEYGSVSGIFRSARHPYTRALLASLPDHRTTRNRLTPIPGAPPVLTNMPTGCAFRIRCGEAAGLPACAEIAPRLRQIDGGHTAACHRLGGSPEMGTAR
ncbi:ABC transporter ATP-binding protein [Ramlibacter tataouinensis]|uniref:ABC transporter ATP-binding protein n=1 Tax=Ramlibacter tataouinensis TaxID=94132 RepID=UPI0022F3BF2C|nr:ABC transporter ATP-binding protein [Ramlibacter tataouinensis]WBY02768.1 ABC transporter ATP-binding protein [Ramlibacter tataouinensis]